VLPLEHGKVRAQIARALHAHGTHARAREQGEQTGAADCRARTRNKWARANLPQVYSARIYCQNDAGLEVSVVAPLALHVDATPPDTSAAVIKDVNGLLDSAGVSPEIDVFHVNDTIMVQVLAVFDCESSASPSSCDDGVYGYQFAFGIERGAADGVAAWSALTIASSQGSTFSFTNPR
jgi:hypothetical protein